jgi:hypothetical protein
MKNFSMIDPSSSCQPLYSSFGFDGLASSLRSAYALRLYQAYAEALADGIEFIGIAGGGCYLCPRWP